MRFVINFQHWYELNRIVEFNLDLTKLLPLVGGGDSLSTGAQPSKLVTLLSQIKAASLGVLWSWRDFKYFTPWKNVLALILENKCVNFGKVNIKNIVSY